jgi:predicted transcriptional regulator
MDLEMLLSSSCRRKILKVLANNRQINIMELVQKVNNTYNQVNSSLQILQKEEIIIDEHFGRMRVVKLNKENNRTLLLLRALKILDNSEDKAK